MNIRPPEPPPCVLALAGLTKAIFANGYLLASGANFVMTATLAAAAAWCTVALAFGLRVGESGRYWPVTFRG